MTADSLTCAELVELVTDYVEGGLTPSEERRFERHLEGCPGCDRYVAQVRATVRLSGSLAARDLAPDGREALLAAFRGWKA